MDHKINKSPKYWSKGFIYISKKWESTYNCTFSKVKISKQTEREGLLNPFIIMVVFVMCKIYL